MSTFSGPHVASVLIERGFLPQSRNGSHLRLRYEHPKNEEDIRIVIVPMEDELRRGTLRSIMEQSGGKDFEKFCEWLRESS